MRKTKRDEIETRQENVGGGCVCWTVLEVVDKRSVCLLKVCVCVFVCLFVCMVWVVMIMFRCCRVVYGCGLSS